MKKKKKNYIFTYILYIIHMIIIRNLEYMFLLLLLLLIYIHKCSTRILLLLKNYNLLLTYKTV